MPFEPLFNGIKFSGDIFLEWAHISSAETPSFELNRIGITKTFSNYALHHLPDDLKLKLIVSLAGMLKPGGKLIVGDLMFSNDPNKYSSLFDYVGYGPGSDTPATVSDLKAMFEQANLKTIVRLLNPISGIIAAKNSKYFNLLWKKKR